MDVDIQFTITSIQTSWKKLLVYQPSNDPIIIILTQVISDALNGITNVHNFSCNIFKHISTSHTEIPALYKICITTNLVTEKFLAQP